MCHDDVKIVIEFDDFFPLPFLSIHTEVFTDVASSPYVDIKFVHCPLYLSFKTCMSMYVRSKRESGVEHHIKFNLKFFFVPTTKPRNLEESEKKSMLQTFQQSAHLTNITHS